MTKQELRKLYLQKRSELSFSQMDAASKEICNLFFNHFTLDKISVIHIFLPIKDRQELDTWCIINQIWQRYSGIKTVIPVSNFKDCSMQSYLLDKETRLKENKWNIPEPESGFLFPDEKIDLIFLPLLAFDESGSRVGYGKGFYDRFLSSCKKDIIKVGLSFFPPVREIEDTNDFDVKMDYCITPEKIYRYKM